MQGSPPGFCSDWLFGLLPLQPAVCATQTDCQLCAVPVPLVQAPGAPVVQSAGPPAEEEPMVLPIPKFKTAKGSPHAATSSNLGQHPRLVSGGYGAGARAPPLVPPFRFAAARFLLSATPLSPFCVTANGAGSRPQLHHLPGLHRHLRVQTRQPGRARHAAPAGPQGPGRGADQPEHRAACGPGG